MDLITSDGYHRYLIFWAEWVGLSFQVLMYFIWLRYAILIMYYMDTDGVGIIEILVTQQGVIETF